MKRSFFHHLMGSHLRRACAKRFINKGDHARPLVVTAGRDPVILSFLGMYRQALLAFGCGSTPVRRLAPAEALALIAASAGTGDHVRAAEIARSHGPTAGPRWRRNAALVLAAANPEAALDLAGRAAGALAAAIHERAGAAEQAASCLGKAEETPDALLLRANIALRAGDHDGHLVRLNQALATVGLEPVARANPRRPLSLSNIAAPTLAAVDGPLVSVIMPVRDTASSIDVAVASVLSQSWRSLELIIIDDGSGDETLRRAEAWAERDARVRVVGASRHAGPYCAKNAGLDLAAGDFVTFHDGDDWSHPRRIEHQMRPLLAERSLAATASRWVRIDATGRFTARQVWPLIRWNPSSLLFRRREVLERIGRFDAVLTGADSEFWHRLRQGFGGGRVRTLRAPLSLGGWHIRSLTGSPRTGFGADGINADRLAYWEAWHLWHAAAVAEGTIPTLAAATRRPFPNPTALTVHPGSYAPLATR
jgi:hypothetical protein